MGGIRKLPFIKIGPRVSCYDVSLFYGGGGLKLLMAKAKEPFFTEFRK